MRPLFLPFIPRLLLAALAAAAVPGAIAARDNGDQAAQDDSGAGRNCVKVMGGVVCKRETAAAAAVAPAAVAARLFAEGPQVSPGNDSRHFALQGFARSGWPLAVDFLPQPGSLTLLIITPYDPAHPAGRGLGKAIRDLTGSSAFAAGSVPIIMDPDGKRGRRLFTLPRLDLPAPQGASGDRPLGIATYTVESYRLSAKGKPSLKRSPVEIFGFGAGPAAVGAAAAANRGRWPPAKKAASLALATLMLPASMSLSQAVLADGVKPPLIRPPKGKQLAVNYRYRRTSSFHWVAEDIWLEKGGKAVKSVFQRSLKKPPLPKPLAYLETNQWMLAPTNVVGQYRLEVRAWLKCDNADFASCKEADYIYVKSAAVAVQ